MEKIMSEPERPWGTSSRFPRFLIGKDRGGRWVVQDQRGLCGGLFVSQADAIRYAMFETARQPQAVIMVPDVIDLDMTCVRTASASRSQRHAA
jgi:hypothetical protein